MDEMADDHEPPADESQSAAPLDFVPPATGTSENEHAEIHSPKAPDMRQNETETVTDDMAHQPESAAATAPASVTSSLKEEDTQAAPAAATSTYGTRSRHKAPSARPNYADDDELDRQIEMAGIRHAEPKAESAISDGSSKSHESRKTQTNGSHSTTVNGDSSSIERERGSSKGEQRSERKRKHADRESGARSAQINDHIPGTSSFSANPTGDAQSSKRRKTTENGVLVSNSAQIGRRKSSSNHKHGSRETCVYSFEKCGALLKDGKLISDDGTVFAPNDNVYLICEPPGDPYYLCRIMEFRHTEVDNPQTPVVSMLVNWFYRPKDINRYNSDPRYLYASMQSDESPITSLRGKCQITHRTQIKDLEEYRKRRDAFWFNQLYDRYISRPYEMLPVSQVTNVPEKVKRALDERWKFLVVEPARMKELTGAVKLCKRCSQYCAPNDSVDCAVCHNTYHMTCVRPALQKKPSRGFGWSCGPCSKAQERRLIERHAAVITSPAGAERDEEEVVDEEEEELVADAAAETPNDSEIMSEPSVEAQADIGQANMWPWRYLGIHCSVDDVLQFDDRAIYPRASSRLGPRHQANVAVWHGRPVELVKPVDIKKKYLKGNANRKDAKLSKETLAAIEADRVERANRPKWVQDQPPGYEARGEDLSDSDPNCTCQRLFVIPEEQKERVNDQLIDGYMHKSRQLSTTIKDEVAFRDERGVAQKTASTNFLDKALLLLQEHDFNRDEALAELVTQSQSDLGNPDFTKEEAKKFDEGVAKHGSDLRGVRKLVKTRPYGQIVRYYYNWKKTPKGYDIWKNFDGRRRAKRIIEASWTEIADDEDDSAFDYDKASGCKRGFQCKHCSTNYSSQWRRAPNVSPGATVLADPKGSNKDKSNKLVVALCQRCAILWRRYALRWEDPEEIAKSIAQSGGRAWKRKNDEESLREMVAANEAASVPTGPLAAAAAQAIGITLHVPILQDPKKKLKSSEKESTPLSSTESGQKKKSAQAPPRQPTPPLVPQQPKLRTLPCAVCSQIEPTDDQLLMCKDCRLCVHRQCYGIPDEISAVKWICDVCLNDRNAQLSITYECILCPVKNREPAMLEPPKASHKKKTDREREKEQLEKELGIELLNSYARSQEEKGRPKFPREALKRSSCNNWVHVTCAVWTPEMKFSNANLLETVEGMGAIVAAPNRLDQTCNICKQSQGVCVSCYSAGCSSKFHVGCAHNAGYTFGFDVHPVKGSRKEMINSVTVGEETGSMSAAIWCNEHTQIKSIVHHMYEIVDETGLNALQLYVQTFKQADVTLTGTARKANLLNLTSRGLVNNTSAPGRRASLLTNGNGAYTKGEGREENETTTDGEDERQCQVCSVSTSPRWHLTSRQRYEPPLLNGHYRGHVNGTIAGLPPRWKCNKCFIRKAEVKPEPEPTIQLERPLDPIDPRTNGHAQPSTTTILPSVHPQAYPVAPFPRSTPQLSATDGRPYSDLHHSALTQSRNDAEWARNLQQTLIWLHRGHRETLLRGEDFGNLNDNEDRIFNFFVDHARQRLDFDPLCQVIRSDKSADLVTARVLVSALVDLIMHGPRQVHWHIIDHKRSFFPHQMNGHHAPLPASSPALISLPPVSQEMAMPLRSPARLQADRTRWTSPEGPAHLAHDSYQYPPPGPPVYRHQQGPWPAQYGPSHTSPPQSSRQLPPAQDIRRPRTPSWTLYGPPPTDPRQPHTPGPGPGPLPLPRQSQPQPGPRPHYQHDPSPGVPPLAPYYRHGSPLQLTEGFAPTAHNPNGVGIAAAALAPAPTTPRDQTRPMPGDRQSSLPRVEQPRPVSAAATPVLSQLMPLNSTAPPPAASHTASHAPHAPNVAASVSVPPPAPRPSGASQSPSLRNLVH